MSATEIKVALSNLNKTAKIEIIQYLWQELYSDFNNQPVSNEHKEIIANRYNSFKQGTSKSRPWSKVKDDLLNEIQNKYS